MTRKQEILAALDIGSSQVKVAIAERDDAGNCAILGLGTAESQGLRKGVVVHIESTIEAIQKAVAEAEAMAGFKVRSVLCSLSGSHIVGLNSSGVVGVRSSEVSHYDVEKVIEEAESLSIPKDRELLHVLPQEFIIDEQRGIREPIGISGKRLEARVHLVTGSIACARNIVKCANQAGLVVDDVIFSGLAAADAILNDEERDLGTCVLDMGAGTTNIIVYHQSALKCSHVVPIGGHHVSNDIAAGLRTPLVAAENMKRRHGSALSKLVPDHETLDVESTGGRERRVMSRQFLAEIIEARCEEIFAVVKRELVKNELHDVLTSGIILTGGSANLHGITELCERVFALPVRIGTAHSIVGRKDIVRHPEYSCLVGLLGFSHRAGLDAPRNRHQSGMVRNAIHKVSNWFSQQF